MNWQLLEGIIKILWCLKDIHYKKSNFFFYIICILNHRKALTEANNIEIDHVGES